MPNQGSVTAACPQCAKPCGCKLQGVDANAWFICPHCRAKFRVEIVVGDKIAPTPPAPVEQVPPLQCPQCAKPCTCRLKGWEGKSWFICPHCRGRFFVEVTVGYESAPAASPSGDSFPRLRCLTEEFDWHKPEDLIRFAQAYQEDTATLARQQPSAAVTAAREELWAMKDAVEKFKLSRFIQRHSLAHLGLTKPPDKKGSQEPSDARPASSGSVLGTILGAMLQPPSSGAPAQGGPYRRPNPTGGDHLCIYCRATISGLASRCPYCCKDNP